MQNAVKSSAFPSVPPCACWYPALARRFHELALSTPCQLQRESNRVVASYIASQDAFATVEFQPHKLHNVDALVVATYSDFNGKPVALTDGTSRISPAAFRATDPSQPPPCTPY